jgi:hypothetical protein
VQIVAIKREPVWFPSNARYVPSYSSWREVRSQPARLQELPSATSQQACLWVGAEFYGVILEAERGIPEV